MKTIAGHNLSTPDDIKKIIIDEKDVSNLINEIEKALKKPQSFPDSNESFVQVEIETTNRFKMNSFNEICLYYETAGWLKCEYRHQEKGTTRFRFYYHLDNIRI